MSEFIDSRVLGVIASAVGIPLLKGIYMRNPPKEI